MILVEKDLQGMYHFTAKLSNYDSSTVVCPIQEICLAKIRICYSLHICVHKYMKLKYCGLKRNCDRFHLSVCLSTSFCDVQNEVQTTICWFQYFSFSKYQLTW